MTGVARIPFNRPVSVGREAEHVAAAMNSGHLSGDGPFTRRCQDLLEDALGVRRVLLTPSCTHALELAALLLDLQPGDEVILPSFTFVSTANAFVLRGAVPVFADIRQDTLNLDASRLPSLITPRTKAIVPVHYAGVGCDMDAIMAVAGTHGLTVVEDNAHGLFGRYRGRWLGAIAPMAALSFHETKNFQCGEGGALLLQDDARVGRAEILREKGTERSRFFRGQVDKYTWVDVGSSYLLADMLAAYLLAQLEARDHVQKRRSELWTRYADELSLWAAQKGVELPSVPANCDQAFHLFYMLMPSLQARQGLIASLNDAGVSAVFHYLPLHLSGMGQKYGGHPGQCPVAEDVSDRLVRLPLSMGLTDADQCRVIAAVLSS
jgi:dTDP-4-amino-4,6-dideoxygalactose transaminase